MSQLGSLLWWRVGEVNLTHSELSDAMRGTGVHLPAPAIPIDIFRRLTTGAHQTYGDLECMVAPVPSISSKMLTHHLVGVVKSDTGEETVRKVGEITFYKPPRGEHSKSRLRVTPSQGGTFDGEAVAFATYLRLEYERGIKGAVDGQGVRRIIRNHLTSQGVLYLEGPYFFQHRTQVDALNPLFDALGDDSFRHDVAFLDTTENRQFLARGVERAVINGVIVDESIWSLLGVSRG